MSSRDLWGSSLITQTSATTSLTSYSGGSAEIDLRAEFDDFIFGTDGGTPHGHWHIIRHMRRDSSGVGVKCSCVDTLTNEAPPDCPYCLGERFLWDETWYAGYSAMVGSEGGLANRHRPIPAGQVRVDYRVFYFRYDTPLQHGDKIIEVLLDEDGKIVLDSDSQYTRTVIYLPETLSDMRSDNGRREYWTIYCKESEAIRPDAFIEAP